MIFHWYIPPDNWPKCIKILRINAGNVNSMKGLFTICGGFIIKPKNGYEYTY